MRWTENKIFKIYPDGTQKQLNPFTGSKVWYIPGRYNRPNYTLEAKQENKLVSRSPEDYCDFCPANYHRTTPEKSRLVIEKSGFSISDRCSAKTVFSQTADFRRIANLFEIVQLSYWQKNYGYTLSSKNIAWKERYIGEKQGLDHVINLIDLKLEYSGLSVDEIKNFSHAEKLKMADAFFGGAHELIVPKRHYSLKAKTDHDLCSSGTLSPDEHFYFMQFTIHALLDIYENNENVRYTSVFQNWLRSAGASFGHLHKQLVALDEWGIIIRRMAGMVSKSPNIFNDLLINFAVKNHLLICENDYALAVVEIGHRHPTVAVYSKSRNCRPEEHTVQELQGFSDIVHAIHAAMGDRLPCNEEWYYQPRDCHLPIPWHVLLKWRINVPAGFEGGTEIFINPLSPTEIRDQLIPRLLHLESQKMIRVDRIGENCNPDLQPLQYSRF